MDFYELIQNRFSVRSYKNEPVEAAKLEQILDAARLAPTAANRQAFKVVVMQTNGREESLRRIYDKEWFVQAPIILGVFSIPEKNWVRSDQWNYSDVDAAIVMDYMILAATNLGFGTCWIGAFDVSAAKEVVGLGKGYEPVAFTPIGYSDSKHTKKTRKPLADLVIYQ